MPQGFKKSKAAPAPSKGSEKKKVSSGKTKKGQREVKPVRSAPLAEHLRKKAATSNRTGQLESEMAGRASSGKPMRLVAGGKPRD